MLRRAEHDEDHVTVLSRSLWSWFRSEKRGLELWTGYKNCDMMQADRKKYT